MSADVTGRYAVRDVFLILLYCLIFDLFWIPVFYILLKPSLTDLRVIPISLIYASLFISFPLSIVLPYFVKRKYGMKIKDLGLNFSKFYANLGFGLLGYITAVTISILIIFVIATIVGYSDFFTSGTSAQRIIQLTLDTKSIVGTFVLIVLLCIYVPTVEELYFRGFMYVSFRARVGIKTASCISAFIFSVAHLDFAYFPYYFIVGIISNYLFEKRKSLIPSICLHSTNNLVAIVALSLGIS